MAARKFRKQGFNGWGITHKKAYGSRRSIYKRKPRGAWRRAHRRGQKPAYRRRLNFSQGSRTPGNRDIILRSSNNIIASFERQTTVNDYTPKQLTFGKHGVDNIPWIPDDADVPELVKARFNDATAKRLVWIRVYLKDTYVQTQIDFPNDASDNYVGDQAIYTHYNQYNFKKPGTIDNEYLRTQGLRSKFTRGFLGFKEVMKIMPACRGNTDLDMASLRVSSWADVNQALNFYNKSGAEAVYPEPTENRMDNSFHLLATCPNSAGDTKTRTDIKTQVVVATKWKLYGQRQVTRSAAEASWLKGPLPQLPADFLETVNAKIAKLPAHLIDAIRTYHEASMVHANEQQSNAIPGSEMDASH